MTDPIAALGLRTTDQTAAAAAAAATASKSKTTLDQSDFLALMTAQLKNQDPTKPIDNTEFVAQMAQFSTVTGISQTNTSLDTANTGIAQTNTSLAAILSRMDALTAAQPTDKGA
jgi:flagellar basal-body rod modification protein FlgD